MKPFILVLSTALIITCFILAFAFASHENDVPEKHIELVLRNIGYQLLLRSNDSTSRILPVKKINEDTYQISFENSIGFIPDTLVNVVDREFTRQHFPKDYLVNVRDQSKETVYGFEMNDATGNLVPCIGRMQGKGRYVVEIEFIGKSEVGKSSFLLFLVPLGLAFFYRKDMFRKKEEVKPIVGDDFIRLGNYRFYPQKNLLSFGDKMIPLSEKEARSMEIFALNRNRVVEREELMKEIWENEGVVVMSRNVDVLISKLRKKLCDDSSIRITNVHGRGYKMVTEEIIA